MKPGERLNASLVKSPRFEVPQKRRDFLGIVAIWSAVIAWAAAAIGSLRLPMPAVFPESNSKVRVGPPENFAMDSVTFKPDLALWMYRDQQGFYAISAICTHLGCIVAQDPNGGFRCPCHGSVFAADGAVRGGPAPRGLDWLALSLSTDGQLTVDKLNRVKSGTRFKV